MSQPLSPRRRQVDGPIRRPVSGRPASAPVVAPVMPAEPHLQRMVRPIPPVAETADVMEVFEYRKPLGRRRSRVWKRASLLVGGIMLATGLFFGAKAFMAAGKIITRNNTGSAPALAASVNPATLKGEGQGRVNFLLLGTGGGDHEGSSLSDTMMVVSLDPKTRDVAMLSVPRDLYVQLKGTRYGKINEANSLGGPDLAKTVVQKVIGVPIHYYISLDFSGFKQAVDVLGGVDINVKQRLDDSEYPCDYNQYKVCGYHQSAGQVHMNGTTALKYARCRKGNCGDDFGRAARQQDVMLAVRLRALQVSTLTNPVKLSGLIDTVGGHVKTDLSLKEIQKLALLAKDIDTSKVENKVLSDAADNYLEFGPASFNAGSILVPKSGNFDYSDIQDFVKNIFADHYLIDENARVEVQNGTNVAGLASRIVQSLKASHYNILPPSTAAAATAKTVIYDYSGGHKPVTVNYLKARFNCMVIQAPVPSVAPIGAGPSTSPAPAPEVRVILGADYQSTVTPSPAASSASATR